MGERDRGSMFGWDLFRDFDRWQGSLWEDFSRMDREFDRRFKQFEREMFHNRQLQLEDFRNQMKQRPQIGSG